LRPTATALKQLGAFDEAVYLHQVIRRGADGALTKYSDLPAALQSASARNPDVGAEWRVHFHVPLHWQPPGEVNHTADHVLGLMKLLEAQPQLCSHLEIETYTWAVMPELIHSPDVVDQLVGEYEWTLHKLAEHGLH
jgi:hypothetical protein